MATRAEDALLSQRDTAAPGESERGFALLIVLWSVVLLALLITHLMATGRGETQLAGNLRTGAVVEAAADGAIYETIFHLLDSSDSRWPADGMTHRIRFADAIVELTITSEAGKLNINTIQPALLHAFLRVSGVDTRTASTLTAAIVDWRFPDASTGQGGAKEQQYRDAGRDYVPPGAPFQSLDELSLAIGMTPAILSRIMPYLSIYHDGDPDTREAAAPILQAIREATGVAPQATTGPADERVVVITAAAANRIGSSSLLGNGRFVRRAAVKIGARADAGLFQILTWDTLPNQ